jgi:hypothetical protein
MEETQNMKASGSEPGIDGPQVYCRSPMIKALFGQLAARARQIVAETER